MTRFFCAGLVVCLAVGLFEKTAATEQASLSYEYQNIGDEKAHCVAQFDSKKLTRELAESTVALLTKNWTDSESFSINCYEEIPPKNTAEFIRKRDEFFKSLSEKEKWLSQLKVADKFERTRNQRLHWLKVEGYIATALSEYVLSPDTSSSLETPFEGQSPHKVCLDYIALAKTSPGVPFKKMLNEITAAHSKTWKKASSSQTLRSYVNSGPAKCSVPSMLWASCIRDQFGSAMDYGGQSATPDSLKSIFSKVNCTWKN